MQGHEIKLAKSQHDTRVWRDNISHFIDSDRFDALDQEHQAAIRAQHAALCDLDYALVRRMELLGLPV